MRNKKQWELIVFSRNIKFEWNVYGTKKDVKVINDIICREEAKINILLAKNVTDRIDRELGYISTNVGIKNSNAPIPN